MIGQRGRTGGPGLAVIGGHNNNAVSFSHNDLQMAFVDDGNLFADNSFKVDEFSDHEEVVV